MVILVLKFAAFAIACIIAIFVALVVVVVVGSAKIQSKMDNDQDHPMGKY